MNGKVAWGRARIVLVQGCPCVWSSSSIEWATCQRVVLSESKPARILKLEFVVFGHGWSLVFWQSVYPIFLMLEMLDVDSCISCKNSGHQKMAA
jgi:hypothetical protein